MIQTDRYLIDLPMNLANKLRDECKSLLAQQFDIGEQLKQGRIDEVDLNLFGKMFAIGSIRENDVFKTVTAITPAARQKLLTQAEQINKNSRLSNFGALLFCAGMICLIVGLILFPATSLSATLYNVTWTLYGCAGASFITAIVLGIIDITPKKKRDAEVKKIITALAEQHIIQTQTLVSTLSEKEGITKYQLSYYQYKTIEIFTDEADTVKATKIAQVCLQRDLSQYSKEELQKEIALIMVKLNHIWISFRSSAQK